MFLVRLFLVALVLAAAHPAGATASRENALRPRVAFSGEDRQITDRWFRRHEGAIKRSYDPEGKVPGRVDRELAPNDRLPTGVPLAHLPWGLERQLSQLPSELDRLIVGRHLVLVERRSGTVLDVMRDVVR